MPVCIVGMHRSGTSLLTQMLSDCGMYLGAEGRIAAAGKDDNPTGYWEHDDFRRINERILERFGGTWKTPPDMASGWVADERLDDLRGAAAEILAGFDGREPWGWKDPRSSLTIPFWRKVAGELSFVVAFRDPRHVATSLQARVDQGHPRAKYGVLYDDALELWSEYYRRISLALGEDHGWPVVNYDCLVRAPADELRRVCETLGLRVHEQLLRRAATRVRPELNRSGAGLVAREEPRAHVLERYGALMRAAQRGRE